MGIEEKDCFSFPCTYIDLYKTSGSFRQSQKAKDVKLNPASRCVYVILYSYHDIDINGWGFLRAMARRICSI